MWNCTWCNCQMIAGSLTFCPMCRKEKGVPKITVDGGPTNAAAGEGEPGYVAADAPVLSEVVPDPAPAPEPVAEVPVAEPAPVVAPAAEPDPVTPAVTESG